MFSFIRKLSERREERRKEKQEMLDKIRAERELACKEAKENYDKLCSQVENVLAVANKPIECNVIRFAAEPYFFPQLISYQCFFVDWEIWRDNDVIYIYRSEVENYPEKYYDGDAPAIAEIPLSAIQHYRVEGTTYTESKISGGKITQNRSTGKITQTPITSKTIKHDDRFVRMSVLVNGVVKVVDFEYSALDVFCALMPEKERK